MKHVIRRDLTAALVGGYGRKLVRIPGHPPPKLKREELHLLYRRQHHMRMGSQQTMQCSGAPLLYSDP